MTLGLGAATETLRGEKDMPGASRSIPAAAVSPPAWDAIPKGTEAPAQLFRVAPVGFAPETLLVILLGTVHGIASAGAFEVEGATRPMGVDVDSGGSLYVTDISGRTVRCGLDGRGAVEVKARPASKPEAQGGPCARSRSARMDGSSWRPQAKKGAAGPYGSSGPSDSPRRPAYTARDPSRRLAQPIEQVLAQGRRQIVPLNPWHQSPKVMRARSSLSRFCSAGVEERASRSAYYEEALDLRAIAATLRLRSAGGVSRLIARCETELARDHGLQERAERCVEQIRSVSAPALHAE